jgi:hypothetical protein
MHDELTLPGDNDFDRRANNDSDDFNEVESWESRDSWVIHF